MIEKATNGRKPEHSKQNLYSKILHLQKSVVSLFIQMKDMKLTRFLAINNWQTNKTSKLKI